MLLLLVPFSWAAYLLSTLVLPTALVAATVHEMVHFPTSHSLLPIELGLLFLGSAVLHGSSAPAKLVHDSFRRGGPSERSAPGPLDPPR